MMIVYFSIEGQIWEQAWNRQFDLTYLGVFLRQWHKTRLRELPDVCKIVEDQEHKEGEAILDSGGVR